MRRYARIKEYLSDLEDELGDVHNAIKTDALDDAEEFLWETSKEILDGGEEDEGKAVAKAAKRFGRPGEIAKEYIKQDRTFREKLEKKREKEERPRSLLCSILGVYGQGRTYLGILYLFLMFPLGIFYFTYMVTMLSLGIGLIPLMLIGLLILFLFLLSNYALSWLHGRMTELMLGIRMPKKRRKLRARGPIWKRTITLFKDPRMYTSLLYMFLMFPLGIVYFTILVTALSVSIGLILSPIVPFFGSLTGLPVGIPGPLIFQVITIPLAFITGLVCLTWTLHLSNIIAYYHGRMTRALLIKR